MCRIYQFSLLLTRDSGFAIITSFRSGVALILLSIVRSAGTARARFFLAGEGAVLGIGIPRLALVMPNHRWWRVNQTVGGRLMQPGARTTSSRWASSPGRRSRRASGGQSMAAAIVRPSGCSRAKSDFSANHPAYRHYERRSPN
jgi:hypothetical protein